MKTAQLTLTLLIALAVATACNPKPQTPAQDADKQKKEALLIGTFHYHNPGLDAARIKDFDVLNERSQQQLEEMAEKIRDFKPGRIFVEWPYERQASLDSLYRLYREGTYFDNGNLSGFHLKNEIFQLAFRTAHKSGLQRVHAIDYRDTEFPFDSLKTVLRQNNQSRLLTEVEEGVQYFTTSFDSRIENGASLLEMTYYLNSDEMRDLCNRIHLEIPLLVGDRDNFIGPFLASEWHRRNLYMWSLAQKGTAEEDQRIVLLLGASHIATIKDYIDLSADWKAVELQAIMK